MVHVSVTTPDFNVLKCWMFSFCFFPFVIVEEKIVNLFFKFHNMIFKKVLNLISNGHLKLSSHQNDKNSIFNIYFYVQVLFCFFKKMKKWNEKTKKKKRRNVNKNLLLIRRHFLEFILLIKCNVKNSNYNQTIYINSIF
jgi:hypothetical protein